MAARRGIEGLSGRRDRGQQLPPPPPPSPKPPAAKGKERDPEPPTPVPAPAPRPRRLVRPPVGLPAGVGRDRLTVYLPGELADQLDVAAEQHLTTYGAYVVALLQRHRDRLPDEGTYLPGRGRRRRVAGGRQVPLYLSQTERDDLDQLLAEGRASSHSHAVSLLLELDRDPAP